MKYKADLPVSRDDPCKSGDLDVTWLTKHHNTLIETNGSCTQRSWCRDCGFSRFWCTGILRIWAPKRYEINCNSQIDLNLTWSHNSGASNTMQFCWTNAVHRTKNWLTSGWTIGVRFPAGVGGTSSASLYSDRVWDTFSLLSNVSLGSEPESSMPPVRLYVILRHWDKFTLSLPNLDKFHNLKFLYKIKCVQNFNQKFSRE
jgi:hypothetical protein